MKALRTWVLISLLRAGWAPLLVFGIHVLMVQVFDAYTAFPALDIPMHFLGGVVIAFFFHHATLAAPECGLTKATDAVTHRVLIFALTCMATIFWEFAEFIADRYFGAHSQPSLQDTLKDMLLGLSGGVVLLLGIAVRRGR